MLSITNTSKLIEVGYPIVYKILKKHLVYVVNRLIGPMAMKLN